MTPDHAFETIDELLRLVLESEPVPSLGELVVALDRVAVAVNSIDSVFESNEWPAPPERQHRRTYAAVGKRFPSLGLYSTALAPLDVQCATLAVGDAVDDLADIAGELAEVRWRWLNTSRNDALWHFRWSFAQHWGAHLRDLQVVLHQTLRA